MNGALTISIYVGKNKPTITPSPLHTMRKKKSVLSDHRFKCKGQNNKFLECLGKFSKQYIKV